PAQDGAGARERLQRRTGIGQIPARQIRIADRLKNRADGCQSRRHAGAQHAPSNKRNEKDGDGYKENVKWRERALDARHQCACRSASPEVATRCQFGSLARTFRSKDQISVTSRTAFGSPSTIVPFASLVAEMYWAANDTVMSATFFFSEALV